MNKVPGLRLGTFEYTTVQAMRRNGLAKVDVSDARVRELIREQSQRVNDITEQWFAPVEGRALLTGRDSPMLPMPNMIPILHVEEVRLRDQGYDENAGEGTLLEASEYVNQGRYIELVDLVFKRATTASSLAGDIDPTGSSRISRGIGNMFAAVPQGIGVRGAFGWMEDERLTRFEATASAASAGATTLTLSTVATLAARDVLHIGEGDTAQRAIVLSVNTGTNQVTVPELDLAVASGAEVHAYGKVPRQIERAVQILVFLNKTPPFGPGVFPARNQPYDPTSNFQEKVTSGYYGTTPTNGVTTGSLEVDLILKDFVAMPFPRMI